MMPFAAVAKIAAKKREYDKQAVQEWLAWEKRLLDRGILDIRQFWPPKFFRQAGKIGTEAFTARILREWKSFAPKILKVKRLPENVSFNVFKRLYLHCLPVNLASVDYAIFNYNDCDPLDYRDFRFLHRDGSPADYGDVFRLMNFFVRPVTVSTAGWFSEDPIACRAMGKVIDACQSDPMLSSKMHRLSVSIHERHAEADIIRYLEEVERMIREASLLKMHISVYYDKGDTKHTYIGHRIAERLIALVEDKLGIKDRIQLTPISYQYGRAVDLPHGENSEMWDPDMNIDGIHICHDGEVRDKPGCYWDCRKRKNGQEEYFLRAPEGSMPEPTGIWLYKLTGDES